MAKAGSTKRVKNKDNARRSKKKTSPLSTDKVEYVDYKDVNLLRRFISDRAKIRARRVSGNDTQQQRTVAQAIKVSREMALIPYTNRVTTQRGGNKTDRRDRAIRADGPPPRPDAPPPPPGMGGPEEGEFIETSEGMEMPESIDTGETTEAVETAEGTE